MLNLSFTTEINFDFDGSSSSLKAASSNQLEATVLNETRLSDLINNGIPFSYQRILNESMHLSFESNVNHITSTSIDSLGSDKEQTQRLLYYLMGLAGIFMFSIGMVTNILNLIILTQKSMKSTTNRYLCALSVCDIFVLIFSLLTLSNSFMNDYSDASDSLMVNLGPTQIESLVTSPIQHFSQTTSSPVATSSLTSPLLSATTAPYMSLVSNPNQATSTIESSSRFSLNVIWAAIKDSLSNLYIKWSVSIYPRLFPYIYPIAIMFQIACVWINLGMSIDRFVAIHFPLKSLKFCTIQNAKRVITFIFVFSLIYAAPRFLEYQVIVDKYSVNNETYEFIYHRNTKIGQSRVYRNIVYVWMYILLQSVLPLIILTIINIVLILSLKESSKIVHVLRTQSMKKKKSDPENRNGHTSSVQADSEQHRLRIWNKEVKRKDITIMLITVVVLFIILQLPAVFCNCIYGIYRYKYDTYPGGKLFSNSDAAVCNVGNLFIITCSATNFFTYCIFNKKFRRELYALLMRCACLKRLAKSDSISRANFNLNSVGLSSRTSYFTVPTNRRKTATSKSSLDSGNRSNKLNEINQCEREDSRKSSAEKSQSTTRNVRSQSVKFAADVIDPNAKIINEIDLSAVDMKRQVNDKVPTASSLQKKHPVLTREDTIDVSEAEMSPVKTRIYQSEPANLLTKKLFKKLSLVTEAQKNSLQSSLSISDACLTLEPPFINGVQSKKAPLASSVTIDSIEDFEISPMKN